MELFFYIISYNVSLWVSTIYLPSGMFAIPSILCNITNVKFCSRAYSYKEYIDASSVTVSPFVILI